MSKSLVYAYNNSAQVVATGGTTLNVGSVVRRYGNHITVSDGSILVQGNGYYNIDVLVNVEANATGSLTVALYKGGVAIPGATSTVSTAADGVYSITIPATFREICCCIDTITVMVSGGAGTVNEVSVRVVKE